MSLSCARINLLGFSEVKQFCDIEIIMNVGFCVHICNGTINFMKKNILYVTDLSAWQKGNNVNMTTEEF